MSPSDPIVLKLASLPRNQIGPFLILGVDKDATNDLIEQAWAQRLIAARKGQLAVPLEDVNWAREILTDSERRIRADVISLNVETTDSTLKKLRDSFRHASPAAQPIDIEPDLSGYTPNVPTLTLEEVRAQLKLPDLPRELPAVPVLLREEHRNPLDPWEFTLEPPAPQSAPSTESRVLESP
jgi:hypothetical protein